MELKLSTAFSFLATEWFSEGKYGPQTPLPNEQPEDTAKRGNDDRVYMGIHFTAVFDGVTGPQGADAAELAVQVLDTMPREATEREFAKAIATAMHDRFGPPPEDGRMAACTGIILSHTKAEMWAYGDAFAVLLTEDDHEVVCREKGFEWADHVHALRAFVNEMHRRMHKLDGFDFLYDNDPGRDALNKVRMIQHHNANVTGGYTVLCAIEVPDDMARVEKVKPAVVRIVLASDGYPHKLMTRENFENATSMNLALAVVNEADQHCMGMNAGPKGITRNPQTGELNASYDDRTAVFVIVVGF